MVLLRKSQSPPALGLNELIIVDDSGSDFEDEIARAPERCKKRGRPRKEETALSSNGRKRRLQVRSGRQITLIKQNVEPHAPLTVREAGRTTEPILVPDEEEGEIDDECDTYQEAGTGWRKNSPRIETRKQEQHLASRRLHIRERLRAGTIAQHKDVGQTKIQPSSRISSKRRNERMISPSFINDDDASGSDWSGSNSSTSDEDDDDNDARESDEEDTKKTMSAAARNAANARAAKIRKQAARILRLRKRGTGTTGGRMSRRKRAKARDVRETPRGSGEERTYLFTLPQEIVETIAEYFTQASRFKMCIVHPSFYFLNESRWCHVIDLCSVGIGSKVTSSGRRVVQRHNINSQISNIRQFLTIRPFRFAKSQVLMMSAGQFYLFYEQLVPLVEELCPNVQILHLLNSCYGGVEFGTEKKGLKETTTLIERAVRGRQIEMAIIEDLNPLPKKLRGLPRVILEDTLPKEPCIIEVEPLSLDLCTAFQSKNNPCMHQRVSCKLYCDRHLKSRHVPQFSFSRQRAIQAEYDKSIQRPVR